MGFLLGYLCGMALSNGPSEVEEDKPSANYFSNYGIDSIDIGLFIFITLVCPILMSLFIGYFGQVIGLFLMNIILLGCVLLYVKLNPEPQLENFVPLIRISGNDLVGINSTRSTKRACKNFNTTMKKYGSRVVLWIPYSHQEDSESILENNPSIYYRFYYGEDFVLTSTTPKQQ